MYFKLIKSKFILFWIFINYFTLIKLVLNSNPGYLRYSKAWYTLNEAKNSLKLIWYSLYFDTQSEIFINIVYIIKILGFLNFQRKNI